MGAKGSAKNPLSWFNPTRPIHKGIGGESPEHVTCFFANWWLTDISPSIATQTRSTAQTPTKAPVSTRFETHREFFVKKSEDVSDLE